MTLGQLIREHRLKKGLTQEELAEKINITARTIQRIEQGKVKPRPYTLQAISDTLGIDYELLHQNNSQQEKDNGKFWIPLLHLSSLFLLLIPSVIIWFWKKKSVEKVREQGIDIINFQLSMLAVLIPSSLLAFLIVPIPIVIFIGIYSFIITVLNTIRVINNQPYHYPQFVKILKP